MVVFNDPVEFVWDDGNIDKNVAKHGVSNEEAEEIFTDSKRKIFKDKLHSSGEERFRILGKTKEERLLFVVFTIRGKKVRIISARGINRKEVYLYEEKIGVTKI